MLNTIQNISTDIVTGLVDSLRFDLFVTFVYANDKAQRIISRIIKNNLILHILPTIFFSMIPLPDFWVWLIITPINLVSTFIHIVFYIELSRSYALTINSKIKSKKSSRSPIDDIVMIIVMAIYQFVMSLVTYLISFIFSSIFITPFIVFFIWTIYYAMYTYNTLWQIIGVDIPNRIKLHEKKWAYFLGHGLVVGLLHTYSDSPLILVAYNIFIGHLLLIPFVKRDRLKSHLAYPSINLSVFSYILGKIIFICNYFLSKTPVT